MFDKLVKAVQIDIGKELTVEIADGHSLAWRGVKRRFVGRQESGKFYIAPHYRINCALSFLRA